ncbi:MAG: serine/threonine protein kinase [Planctomycetes bacterium]|nr:serine/threonine protein kinase [Planctomycetota bacterium]
MVEVPGYRIERLLSWGSQGDVFLAKDVHGEHVALKIVTPERVEGEHQGLERLRREGRMLAAIDSPHVVGVRGYLETPAWSCLVLQYLDGQRLDAAVRERAGEAPPAEFDARAGTVVLPRGTDPVRGDGVGPKEVAAALQNVAHVQWGLGIAMQLARGVAALHAKNLVHRDLKPQNAMLQGDRVVLIDFGFARMDGMTTLTQSGAAIGTLAFMSPEQFRGGGATWQSDVYGLGATLYFLLTGLPPVDAGAANLAALGTRRFAPSVRRKNPAVPKNLDAVLRRALQPDPRDRYQGVAEVLADLGRCQRGEAVRLPFSVSRLWRQRRRQLAWLAALLLVGLLSAWFTMGFRAAAVAQQLLAEVGDGGDAASRHWQGLDEAQRELVTAALNERIGADAELAAKVARELHLGLLRVDGRPKHQGVLLPSNGLEAPRSPAAAEFLSLEEPRNLLVRPGRAWFLVMSSNPTAWWSEDDARVMQMLIQVAEPLAGEVAVRSLRRLPTEMSGEGSFVRFMPATVSLRTTGEKSILTVFADPIAIASEELDNRAAGGLRQWLRGLGANGRELDCWLAHPGEPDGVADAFWGWVQSREGGEDNMPHTCAFWFAHRLATVACCRLPAFLEWQRAAFESGPDFGTEEQRVIPARPCPANARQGWDVTPSGLWYLNSNVAEWTLHETVLIATSGTQFVATPLKTGRNGRFSWMKAPAMVGVPLVDKQGRIAEHGLRLYRTIVSGK